LIYEPNEKKLNTTFTFIFICNEDLGGNIRSKGTQLSRYLKELILKFNVIVMHSNQTLKSYLMKV